MESEYPKMYMYRRIVEAKLYIDQNFSDEIQLSRIADKACFSKYHFLRIFKQTYGMSPHQYLTQVRLTSAKSLIQEGHTITEACELSGFQSIPSFTNLFKRHTGISPKRFAQIHADHQRKTVMQPRIMVPNCFAQNFNWNI